MPRTTAPLGAAKMVQVMVPAGTLKQIDALAQSRLMSRTAIMREALQAYLKGLKRPTG